MNELPIVILSKQLKYSLANEKVKTLQKAIELLPKLSENQQNKKKTIQKLASKYEIIKENVINQFRRVSNKQSDIKGQSTQQMIKNVIKVPTPFYQFLLSKTICQIFGPKGSGKTSFLLHLAEQFALAHRNYKNEAKIMILNCVSGITQKRLEKLKKFKQQGMNVECIEIPSVQDIVKLILKIKQQLNQDPRKKIFIGIDMMVLLLITKEKPKPLVVKIFRTAAEIVSKYSCVLFFTNLVQHKFELGNQELYNHASYHCLSTAEYLTHKMYLQRPDKTSAGRFKLTNIKGKRMQAFFQIEVNGISQLNAYRIE